MARDEERQHKGVGCWDFIMALVEIVMAIVFAIITLFFLFIVSIVILMGKIFILVSSFYPETNIVDQLDAILSALHEVLDPFHLGW